MALNVANELRFHFLTARNPQTHEIQKVHNRIYQFWHDLWLNTFNELTGEQQLFADDFHRQDEYVVLTIKDEIIAYHAYSFFNLELQAHLGHSYFKSYPPDAIQKLKEMGLNKLMVMGYYSVAPAWRKSKGDVAWIGETLVALAYRRFKESNLDSLVTVTRNNRKVNELTAMFGSRCLKAKQILHNVEVDLVYTLKHEVKNHPNRFVQNIADRLWADRILYTDEEIKVPAKKAA